MSLCLALVVCVRLTCLCFHRSVLYVYACRNIVSWWGST